MPLFYSPSFSLGLYFLDKIFEFRYYMYERILLNEVTITYFLEV